MDVLQEKNVHLYTEQPIYKHNVVDENYNMCKGHIPKPVFPKILFGIVARK